MDITAAAVLILLIIFVLIVVVRAVRVIQQGYVGAVKRLGQFNSVRNPGVVFLVPFVDTMELVDMRETPRTGDRQDVITRDNVSVTVNATIFSQVVDAQMALFSVSNYGIAVDQLSRTTLRAVFGGISLDEALSQREHINAQLQSQMESVTDKWGIRINRIEMTAEGVRQATILQAEGQRQAQILNAEGRAQAVKAVYDAINAAGPTPELLSILQLDTLARFADSDNEKIIIPVESAAFLGAAAALRSVIAGVKTAET